MLDKVQVQQPFLSLLESRPLPAIHRISIGPFYGFKLYNSQFKLIPLSYFQEA